MCCVGRSRRVCAFPRKVDGVEEVVVLLVGHGVPQAVGVGGEFCTKDMQEAGILQACRVEARPSKVAAIML